jgi:hypothetical protein
MPARGGAGRLELRCPDERRIATPMVHRIRAVLAACPHDPPSVLGGRLLVRWSERRTVVVVTAPGADAVNQRLVVTLADHVRLVGPRRWPDADGIAGSAGGLRCRIECAVIIPMIIQRTPPYPSGASWIDTAPNVSRQDPSYWDSEWSTVTVVL